MASVAAAVTTALLQASQTAGATRAQDTWEDFIGTARPGNSTFEAVAEQLREARAQKRRQRRRE